MYYKNYIYLQYRYIYILYRPNGQVWLRHNIFTVSAGVQISLGLKEISSVGRAVALHAKGQVFESPISYRVTYFLFICGLM